MTWFVSIYVCLFVCLTVCLLWSGLFCFVLLFWFVLF